MKVKITTEPARGVSWVTDNGVCIAVATGSGAEIAEYAAPRVRDAAHAAHRELAANPEADLRHYLGMTLPADPETADECEGSP